MSAGFAFKGFMNLKHQSQIKVCVLMHMSYKNGRQLITSFGSEKIIHFSLSVIMLIFPSMELSLLRSHEEEGRRPVAQTMVFLRR